jgi:hypothetical protein
VGSADTCSLLRAPGNRGGAGGPHHPPSAQGVGAAGIGAQVDALVLAAYDQMIGLELADVAVGGCITKAPCGGTAPALTGAKAA